MQPKERKYVGTFDPKKIAMPPGTEVYVTVMAKNMEEVEVKVMGLGFGWALGWVLEMKEVH